MSDKAEEARKKADDARKKAEEARKKAEDARKKAEDAKKRAEEDAKKSEQEAKTKDETLTEGQRLLQIHGEAAKDTQEAEIPVPPPPYSPPPPYTPSVETAVYDQATLWGPVDENRIVEFNYSSEIGRFRVRFNDSDITHISLSDQIAYVLGFPNRERITNNEVAKYGPDMNGGFGSFAVYCNGLTQSVIVGNSLSSMLRIVAVQGSYGQMVEKIYDNPMFIPVLPREINEIDVELRLLNGALVPFQFGTVLIVLAFKKVINF